MLDGLLPRLPRAQAAVNQTSAMLLSWWREVKASQAEQDSRSASQTRSSLLGVLGMMLVCKVQA